MKQIWHPAPRGLIQAAAAERWTRQAPAPDIVVYLWIWSQHDDNERPTRRQIARLFGWTEHYSRLMLKRVAKDHKAWVDLYSPTFRTGNHPPDRSNIKKIQAEVTRISPSFNPESPDHARGSTLQHTHNTPRETDTLCLEDIPAWQALK